MVRDFVLVLNTQNPLFMKSSNQSAEEKPDHTPLEIKQPQTDYDIHPLMQKRWSPRAFSVREITEEQLHELFEAARWAPSSFNEQPWRYVYAHKNTDGFDQLLACLASGNQAWAHSAAVLMVTMYRKTFSKNGKPNPSAPHDLGMANTQLILQAAHRDIYGHYMAGFDKERVRSLLALDEDTEPLCMGALGYLGDPDQLEEPLKKREYTPRSRMDIREFTEPFEKG